jgi:hypothetical protein
MKAKRTFGLANVMAAALALTQAGGQSTHPDEVAKLVAAKVAAPPSLNGKAE